MAVGLERFWNIPEIGNDVGPSLDMWNEIALIKDECSRLSHGEKLIMLIVIDMWNGGAQVSIYEMWSHLEPRLVHQVANTMKLCLPLPD